MPIWNLHHTLMIISWSHLAIEQLRVFVSDCFSTWRTEPAGWPRPARSGNCGRGLTASGAPPVSSLRSCGLKQERQTLKPGHMLPQKTLWWIQYWDKTWPSGHQFQRLRCSVPEREGNWGNGCQRSGPSPGPAPSIPAGGRLWSSGIRGKSEPQTPSHRCWGSYLRSLVQGSLWREEVRERQQRSTLPHTGTSALLEGKPQTGPAHCSLGVCYSSLMWWCSCEWRRPEWGHQ